MASKKIEYWYKRIPEQHQEQLNGLERFKISLSKIKKRTKREKELIKSMLNLKVLDIFNDIQNFDLEKSKKYLKTTIDIMILRFDNIKEIKEEEIENMIKSK